MITRVVKMKFRKDGLPHFLTLFKSVRLLILQQRGCLSLELQQDVDDPQTLFTISRWDELQCLEAYRASELFAGTWKKTKSLFEAPASAWSLEEVTDFSE